MKVGFETGRIISVNKSEAKLLNDKLVNRALKMEGTSTGEHGIGIGKKEFLKTEQGLSVEIMSQIKKAIDPKNIMNAKVSRSKQCILNQTETSFGVAAGALETTDTDQYQFAARFYPKRYLSYH